MPNHHVQSSTAGRPLSPASQAITAHDQQMAQGRSRWQLSPGRPLLVSFLMQKEEFLESVVGIQVPEPSDDSEQTHLCCVATEASWYIEPLGKPVCTFVKAVVLTTPYTAFQSNCPNGCFDSMMAYQQSSHAHLAKFSLIQGKSTILALNVVVSKIKKSHSWQQSS